MGSIKNSNKSGFSFWDRKRVKKRLRCQGLSGGTQTVPIVIKICSRVLEASLLRIMERFLTSDHFFVSYSLGLGSEICVWDRKYVEKIIFPNIILSHPKLSLHVPRPMRMDLGSNFFTFHLRKVVLGSKNPIFGIEKTKFAKPT